MVRRPDSKIRCQAAQAIITLSPRSSGDSAMPMKHGPIVKRNLQMPHRKISLTHPIILEDADIQALLEHEREKLIQTTNFLEAICAKLSARHGVPRLSIVDGNSPLEAAEGCHD
ncbi:hypothetical protein O8B93_24745 [Agrobacterium rhizogenes]|uniref:hypothetical protein n=1 Tax=Rhizobium rhizogenes TaxID=359 RepID=UPI0022B7061D|nr:hypothetical protein [Rhizobium rhizogenes]MCZ7450794.1 hypothetical protein [Rhizobium rhizogenes]